MQTPRIRRPRLSFANVASALALVIATSTGGAYAHGMIGSSDIKRNAVKPRHINNGAVRPAELRDGAVIRAKIRSGAVTHPKLGPDVAAARAYGMVLSGGWVRDGRNLTPANVLNAATGVYCIRGLSFTPHLALVSSAFAASAGHHSVEVYGTKEFGATQPPCTADTQFQVHVYEPGTTTLDNGHFNIVIY